MKKRILDKGLYAEGLRRISTITVVFSLLSAVFASVSGMLAAVYSSRNIRPMGFAWFCVIFVFAGVPAMTLRAFSFLNKRSGSDFFHSLPHTRTAVFFSFLAALITCISIPPAVSVLSSFTVGLFLNIVTTEFVTELLLIFSAVFIASFFVSAVMLAAASVSGSVFTELALGATAVTIPQILVMIFKSYIERSVPAADVYSGAAGNSGILQPSVMNAANLTLRLLFWMIGYDATDALPYLHTAAAGLLYCAAAYLLFRSRKSETAEHSAPSRLLQAVFRVITACAVSFIGTHLIVSGLFDGIDRMDVRNYIAPAIVFYVIAVIIYFIFELISTKGKRNVLKAAPALGIVVAANVAFAGAYFGAYLFENAYGTDPAAVTKITTVYVEPKAADGGSVYRLSEIAVQTAAEDGVTIYDGETSERICGLIKDRNQSKGKNGTGERITVSVTSRIFRRTRTFRADTQTADGIRQEVKASEKYWKALRKLPAHLSGRMINDTEFVLKLNGRTGKYCDDRETDGLIATLKDELQSVDAEKWEEFVTNDESYGSYFMYSSQYGWIKIPLSKDVVPQTYQAALRLLP
ncbi:MAG: hypothetical protein J5879_08935 [Clostridia bacterium]|nr:hypothetical protein [Clostridia bacterium]